jgi:uncharacterized protein YwqG
VAKLTDDLQKAGLGPQTNEILELARISARLEPQRCAQSDLARGASRFGGTAELPAGYAWPVYNEHPLSFLAQIDLSTLPKTVRELPTEGSLAFFYETETMPRGLDPKHVGSAHVAYFPPGTVLHPTPAPEGAQSYEPCSLTISRRVDLPHLDDFVSEPLREKLAEKQRVAYGKVVASEDETYHHLLGHPQLIQKDMRVACELVTHGFNCTTPEGYKEGRSSRGGAAEWTLLLQLDTDDEEEGPGWTWGDGVGRIYFWITRADLEAKRFDRIWLGLQCY